LRPRTPSLPARATWLASLIVPALVAGGVIQAVAADVARASTPVFTRLGIRGTDFTLNGRPAFLYGISYYGALGGSRESILKDLDDLPRYRFNWLRVWANWSAFGADVAAVAPDGGPRQPFLSQLQWLVRECDRRGLVVDVTLTRGNGANGGPALTTQAAHLRAVETLVIGLSGLRNWYLDLSNERNIRDARHTSFDDLRALRQRVRELDAGLLVTASQGGDISREELRRYLEEAHVDFLTPHRDREPASPAQTEAQSREYLAWLKELGRQAPVHYQEPMRRGYARWEPAAADFEADLRGALRGGAAGWCFHNGASRGAPESQPRRSFDLRQRRLFEQLDAEELEALDRLRPLVSSRN
jgi:hypothetical protein